jgi:hypothetical protein
MYIAIKLGYAGYRTAQIYKIQYNKILILHSLSMYFIILIIETHGIIENTVFYIQLYQP